MKRTIIFIVIGVLVVSFFGATFYFVSKGVAVNAKMEEYFDVYKQKAEDYIESSPEIKERYGEIRSVVFDDTITYKENKKTENRFARAFSKAFNPKAPVDVNEFESNTVMLKFEVEINDDDYNITFEKNEEGKLVVTSLTADD